MKKAQISPLFINKVFYWVIAISIFTTACTGGEDTDFGRAQDAISDGHFRIAVSHLDKIVRRNSGSEKTISAAREAARLSFYELQDYKRAISYYKLIVLISKDDKERWESQKQIANIFFNNLQNYEEAIVEYHKLLQLTPHNSEANAFRLNIARALYYMGNFLQAELEIDRLIGNKTDEGTLFSGLMLKSNILAGRKEYLEAAKIFKNLLDKYPEKSSQENVVLMLAVCYEETQNFEKAIQVLQQYRNLYKSPEYIDLRIKRVKERQRNAPGAKGFRK